MKRLLVTAVLGFTLVAAGQQPTQPSQPDKTQAANAPASQKVIRDPAEYDAYIKALNTPDPAAKAAAMEAFIAKYPQSVVLTDALEQAMAGYQQSQNTAKVEEMAKRILQLQPNHIRALAVVTAIDRGKATGGDAAALKDMCTYSQSGVRELPGWQKPEGLSDADFDKLRNQMSNIFNGAAGFCALQAKNYAQARDFYTKALQIDPTNLQDTYQLAVGDLEINPIDVNGLWYCAKAISLAQAGGNAQAVDGMQKYCKFKYHRYHGGDDGWDPILTAAPSQNALPAGFTVKPAPTPCELAVSTVDQNDPAGLSFSDWEFILSKAGCSPANKAAADKVWQAIQAKQTTDKGPAKLKIPVKVITPGKENMDVAITDENQQAEKADMHVVFEKPVLHPLDKDKTTDIIGVITSYTPDPFMFTMEQAELPASKTPPRHTPARKKK